MSRNLRIPKTDDNDFLFILYLTMLLESEFNAVEWHGETE